MERMEHEKSPWALPPTLLLIQTFPEAWEAKADSYLYYLHELGYPSG